MQVKSRTNLRGLQLLVAAGLFAGASAAVADDVVDEAEEEVREHPFISATTGATTGALLSDHVEDNHYARANRFVDASYVALRRHSCEVQRRSCVDGSRIASRK